jgi:protease secretion system membrane fusion protein
VRINHLSINAALNSTELDYINVMAAESRLLAERDDRSEITWMPHLEENAQDPRVDAAKRQQLRVFLSRKAEINGQLKILRERMAGLKAQASELTRVISARSNQLAAMDKEVTKNNELADRGFVSRSKVSEVERLQSEVIASLATGKAELGKARSEIASTQLEMDQQMAIYRRDIEAQLAEGQKQRNALHNKVDSLKFDMSLTDLRAPISGNVVGLKVNTVGGVIQPGIVLMEIVPNDGDLIIEAKVPPRLVDKVKVGLEADMRFTAFNLNTTPVIPGAVKMVGADLLVGPPQTQPPEYYLTQIETTAEGRKLLQEKQVQAGMPVDVNIRTGERTFISYLVKPITDRMATSFRDD